MTAPLRIVANLCHTCTGQIPKSQYKRALCSTHTKALTFQKSQHLDSEPRPAIFPVGVRLIVVKISRCLAWEGLSRVAPVEPAGEYEVGIAEASEDTEHRRQSVRASHLANIQNPL